MMGNFNFLGLPLVVQDLITNEIVHNSIPEDRIQLALTSKYCNELVQRAKPKKIIDRFTIMYHPHFTFVVNQIEYTKTKDQLMEILPNCQIKHLELGSGSIFLSEDCSEILGMLSEAARFATIFDISYSNFNQRDGIVGFYVKLKHLKYVIARDPELILPYYPSKVTLNFGLKDLPTDFLKDLAEKLQNCPLSFFELIGRVSLEKCQQFFQTAKFSIGAEIYIYNFREDVSLTYLGQNIFMLELYPDDPALVFISQKFVGRNRRIKLKALFSLPEMAVNIVSASNPEKNYFSGVFKEEKNRLCLEQTMLINIENVDRDEILKVKFGRAHVRIDNLVTKFSFSVRPMYSAKMLESAFPTANFTTPLERIKKINNVLGTNIQLIQLDNFVKAIRKIQNIQI